MSRSQAKQLGDFIDPGQAGLVIVGESKVEDAVKNAVTRAEKQTAQELNVDPKDLDKTLQQAVNEMWAPAASPGAFMVVVLAMTSPRRSRSPRRNRGGLLYRYRR